MYLRTSSSKILLLLITLLLLPNISCNNNVNTTSKKRKKKEQLSPPRNTNKKPRLDTASQTKGSRKSEPIPKKYTQGNLRSFLSIKQDSGAKSISSSLPNSPLKGKKTLDISIPLSKKMSIDQSPIIKVSPIESEVMEEDNSTNSLEVSMPEGEDETVRESETNSSNNSIGTNIASTPEVSTKQLSSSQAAAGKKKNKLKFVLFKETVTTFLETLKRQPTNIASGENSPEENIFQPEIKIPEKEHFIEKEGKKYLSLFVFEERPTKQPTWLRPLRDYCTNKSVMSLPYPYQQKTLKSALVFVEVEGRKFAYVCGQTGMSLLKKNMLDSNFGLITTLNTIDENSRLKSLAKISRGHNTTRTKKNFSKARELSHIPIGNKEQLLKMELQDESGSKNINYEGPSAIVHVTDEENSVENYPEICSNLLALRGKKDYEKEYSHLDNITPLSSTDPINKKLDEKLAKRIKESHSGWNLTVFNLDNIIDKESKIGYYKLINKKSKKEIEDLGTYLSLEEIAHKLKELTKLTNKTQIKEKLKIDILDTNKRSITNNSYPIYKFLSIDIELNDITYTLIGGKWHQVKKKQYQYDQDCIDKYFIDEMTGPILPKVSKDIIKSRSTEGYMEMLYCKEAAKLANFLLMDRRLITAAPSSKKLKNTVELCDLIYYDPSSSPIKYLIHIKDWSASSTFSHLGNQGIVPTTTILKTREGRKNIQTDYLRGELVDAVTEYFQKYQEVEDSYVTLIENTIKKFNDNLGCINLEWIQQILKKEFGNNKFKAKSKKNDEILKPWLKYKEKQGPEDDNKQRSDVVKKVANRLYKRIRAIYLKKCGEVIIRYLSNKHNINTFRSEINKLHGNKIEKEDLNTFLKLFTEKTKIAREKVSIAIPLEEEDFNPTNYTVLYAFFHTDKRDKLSDYLPFFSVQTVLNCLKTIHEDTSNFDVKVKRIEKESIKGAGGRNRFGLINNSTPQSSLKNTSQSSNSTQTQLSLGSELTKKNGSSAKQTTINFLFKKNTQSQIEEDKDASDNEDKEDSQKEQDAGDKEESECSTTNYADCLSEEEGNQNSTDEENSYQPAINKRKGLKNDREIVALLNQELENNYPLGEAEDTGDCFFDALAQHINIRNDTDVNTMGYLRRLCHDYYLKNKAEVDGWIQEDYGGLDKGREEYYMVQYTAEECAKNFNGRPPIWGRPWIEGRILIQQLDIEQFIVIEMLEDPDTKKLVTSYHLVQKDSYTSIDAEACKEIIQKEDTPVLVNAQDSLHYVPLLSSRILKERSSSHTGGVEKNTTKSIQVENEDRGKGKQKI